MSRIISVNCILLNNQSGFLVFRNTTSKNAPCLHLRVCFLKRFIIELLAFNTLLFSFINRMYVVVRWCCYYENKCPHDYTTNPVVSFLALPLALRPTITPFGSKKRRSVSSPLMTGRPIYVAGSCLKTAATFIPLLAAR